jgi:hypothetical protein
MRLSLYFPFSNVGSFCSNEIMDLCDSLNVRFHFGGEFIWIGPQLQYVGGDESMSEIERTSLSVLKL